MKSYKTVALHELFYYNNSKRLSKAFSPLPRAAIQTAFAHPEHYLGSTCSFSQEYIHPDLNDTAIAYRLHLECGRMINLYDWYTAFASIINGPSRLSDKEILYVVILRSFLTFSARFRRAVSEMLLCGFIKPTTRKTDHVIRLTWGSAF